MIITNRYSHKRATEKLVQCVTHASANTLKLAAEKRNDEQFLVQIRDTDLLAKEVHYHRSCYRDYTREISERRAGCTNEQKTRGRPFEYTKSFNAICQNVIESRIIKGGEVLRMNELTRLFLTEIRTGNESEETITYRNCQLKRRLEKRYPQLLFIKNRDMNSCELVLSEFRHVSKVVQCDSSTESENMTEDEDDELENEQNIEPHHQEGYRDMYRAAMFLRNKIAEVPYRHGPWPPTASSLDDEAVKCFVPHQLFNFFAWCVGESDEINFQDYVPTKSPTKEKLYSVCQDIVYIATKGRVDTPKHLALGMAIRHHSGSSKIVGLLNGFGHSISHSKLLVYDTALAERQMMIEDGLPPGLKKNVPTTLAWDNNDFGEETKFAQPTTLMELLSSAVFKVKNQ
jgi:hypothetical protein